MKIMKKILCIILISIIILYVPTIAKATESEQILQDAKEFLNQSTTIVLNPKERMTKTFNQSITHAANIPITRSTTSGISLTITQNSGYTADVCIFNHDASTVIGNTQKAYNNSLSTLNWTANELGNERNVLIYITCYRDITFRAGGSITYQ